MNMEKKMYVQPQCEIINLALESTIICESYRSASGSIKSVGFGDGSVGDEGELY